MENESRWKKFIHAIERFIPMTLTSLFMFLFILYLFFIVGRSIWINYNSNKELEDEAVNIASLEANINLMQNQINYYQTSSFKEKEAREKLGYKASGENIMALPLDKEEEKVADPVLGEVSIKTPNYRLWWQYIVEGRR